jgi:hypothetical protein
MLFHRKPAILGQFWRRNKQLKASQLGALNSTVDTGLTFVRLEFLICEQQGNEH